jgi:small subunit ribosomal protein S9
VSDIQDTDSTPAADDSGSQTGADAVTTDPGVAEVTVTTDEPADASFGYLPPAGGADLGLGTGRRKEAIVRVRLTRGSGQWTLNGKPLDVYFPNKLHQQLVTEPFRILERENGYDVTARLSGGGVSGQAGALRLAISRALIVLDAGDRPALKRAGFLTRDPRVTERKKYGLKKARKAPQYSKR